ncbi:MAG: hypothetical protein U0670_12360 [Anaerolineae bacterium]
MMTFSGIWGNPDVTGKSAATDIVCAKSSRLCCTDLPSPELVSVYQRPTFEAAEVAHALNLLDQVGAKEYARQNEAEYYQKAIWRAQPK